MSNATQSLAGTRITSLLDANSFVEIGQSVTARSTDFNMTANKAPSDGVITWCWYRRRGSWPDPLFSITSPIQ